MLFKKPYYSEQKPKRRFSFLFISLLLITNICIASPERTTPLKLTFGVYQTDKATVIYKKFIPFIEKLQRIMESATHNEVEIKLNIFRDYEEGIEALTNSSVDFVRFGPSSYIIAKNRNKNIRLLALEEKNGGKIFKGIIAVRNSSQYKSLGDLKNSRFAFGNKFSTIGRYLAQHELMKAGIYAKTLQKYAYLGRHDKVYSAIDFGDYDAGSMKMSTFKRLNKDNKLRIIHTFDNVTKPWIASSNMPDSVYKLIKTALVNLKDPSVLNLLKISNFSTASISDYSFIRHAMQKAKQF